MKEIIEAIEGLMADGHTYEEAVMIIEVMHESLIKCGFDIIIDDEKVTKIA